jgi:hypothetical protein
VSKSKMAGLLVTGLALSGCAETFDGFATSPGQEVYAAPGYYGPPGYYAPGYYNAPGPVYVAPYGYQRGWGGGREDWRDHDRHDHGNPNFQSGSQQFHHDGRPPPMAGQPRMSPVAPPPAAAPPPARAQADQNRKLIDQLGFRPSH